MPTHLHLIVQDDRLARIFSTLDHLVIHHYPDGSTSVGFFVGWVENNPPFPYSFHNIVRIPATLITSIVYPGPHWGDFVAFSAFIGPDYIGRMIIFRPHEEIQLMGPYNFHTFPIHFD